MTSRNLHRLLADVLDESGLHHRPDPSSGFHIPFDAMTVEATITESEVLSFAIDFAPTGLDDAAFASSWNSRRRWPRLRSNNRGLIGDIHHFLTGSVTADQFKQLLSISIRCAHEVASEIDSASRSHRRTQASAAHLDGLERFGESIAWYRRHFPDAEPTSSITGSGAIALLEHYVAGATGFPHAVAVSSGSAALSLALSVLGLGDGAAVSLRGGRWQGDAEVVRSVGATPDVGPSSSEGTITVANRDGDVHASEGPAGIHIVDLSLCPPMQWGSASEDVDAAIISFGPGKRVDAGEGGITVMRTLDAWSTAIGLSQHAVRQSCHGLAPSPNCSTRMHPVAAVAALHALHDEYGREVVRLERQGYYPTRN